ncbi:MULTISPECIES: DUF5365 family protein [unclassified Bacillus (in: firmicutes)]|uniref:DUF5365 family protein n=1 Tax=unclassified Bacillus (in: firmicutes) TaxID=185979 RepID=UPI0006CCBEE4|nr:DUF5365 family protein [Bacillus sp. CHD6a]KPB03154.1 hypothetical protein AAV98_18810 [Bacillus sp. CHD6a]MEA3322434.1 DUF5365 family protein [Bacillota bacterium]NMH71479.1 YhcU family protein [Bacillus sp. RO2]
MKVVYASTPEQEDHIGELVQHLLTNILPYYFTDKEIENLAQQLSLHTGEVHDTFSDYNGTLKEAFHIISCLQAIIAVIETIQEEDLLTKHREIFKRNVNMLREFGFSFPFSIDQFVQKPSKPNIFSKFIRPSNHFLI